MDIFEKKKHEYVNEISMLVLEKGISHCSLKKMAEACSTSDRMLMHYFKDKNEILTLALNRVSQDLIHFLQNDSAKTLKFEAFVCFIKETTKSSTIRPYLGLWFELIELAAGKGEPYQTIAKEIGDAYWNWIISLYEPAANEDPESMAALLFTLTEGLVMLDKMGMGSKGDDAINAILKIYNK